MNKLTIMNKLRKFKYSLGVWKLKKWLGILIEKDMHHHRFFVKNGTVAHVLKKIEEASTENVKLECESFLPFSYNNADKQWRSLLCDFLNTSQEELQNEKMQDLFIFIQKNLSALSQESVDLTERIFIFCEQYEEAYCIRKLSEQKLILDYPNVRKVPRVYYMPLFLALNTSKEPQHEKKQQLINSLNKVYKITNKEMVLQYFRLILPSDISIPQNRNRKYEDERFKRLVSGKKIAVLGPADGDINFQKIRDDFDVIITINHMPFATTDNIPDISYYNGGCGRRLIAALASPETKGPMLQYYVFKVHAHRDVSLSRTIVPNCDFLLHNASCNMIPLILMDLLYFSPSYIKVFNSNFYLKKTVYHEDYLRNLALNTAEQRKANSRNHKKAFAVHNVYAQFEFIKTLYNTGCVDFDAMGEELLQISNEDFMRTFSSIHKSNR